MPPASAPATALREPAPAKVNLYLHVTGRREDGLHLLDSLVVFADVGDTLTLAPAPSFSLTRGGPMAPALTHADADDLVVRSVRAMEAEFGRSADFAIRLDKHLPVAAGIGGGSADAAAALRLVARHWDVPANEARLYALAERLGADVPVCLADRASRVGGIGERLSPVDGFPALPAVLVNPNEPVATAAVFRALAGRPAPSAGTDAPVLPSRPSREAVFAVLEGTRNDLESPARTLCPSVGAVIAALSGRRGALAARMSGSGATCFALFADDASAREAAASLAREHPEWWVAATRLG